ncbi:MAG TPA: cbb3-type cytochrome c oxidase subunit I [Gemmatimonadales bacterium]|nr:cbb3-type cytochrome c oxidase subunit I [Gemmatimonadales bacterium]
MTTQRPLTVQKTRIDELIDADHSLTRLVYAYIACAAIWLVFGTLVGEYLGLKFVWPDFGVEPWLSFGRLRPVHTNVVLWGWASLGMIGLALWVVPRTCQRALHSTRLAWISLLLLNAAVLAGVICLASGVNNGGGEYREFIWPVMGTFALGIILLAYNVYRTIAARATEEIYISNWYILGALLWTIVLVVVGYLPWYQNGLGDTVIQGYYMHMGVGMWFTPMVLGLTYYFLPKLLNKPIYSYSLGVLAFWTQMVFYSMIGAHHFVFSPIPWWLQTVAIVFSVGMLVPVVAGTGNFLLTMRGSWSTIARSYSLPFILGGVLFYFFASTQGTFEAFRSLNRVWHFTNFTVAHAHLTVYGFVVFLIWGGVYGLLPRITGREPPQLAVGAHFWLALVGVLVYGFALMIGGTLQGQSWIAQAPFIDSVTLMAPYWTGRAVGGTLMFLSHLIFAYNVWKMRPGEATAPSPAVAAFQAEAA